MTAQEIWSDSFASRRRNILLYTPVHDQDSCVSIIKSDIYNQSFFFATHRYMSYAAKTSWYLAKQNNIYNSYFYI